ncbi:MAG: DUF2271 domain-containing protein [Verrucomicrobiales bacterium]|nr:DUF2271 domain-containing protein [Verrucomicrobiales bacterium]
MGGTGVLAFARPFSSKVMGLHTLMGFVFIALIISHVVNNFAPLKNYFRGKALWFALCIIAGLSAIFILKPAPIAALLRLSPNIGPSQDQFEMNESEMVYQYSPVDHYKMALTIKTGKAFDLENPPYIAIWLENQSAYHIKTLLVSDKKGQDEMLPYWNYKVRAYEQAKKDAETEVYAVSAPTLNSSFDPADYILPADSNNPTPYQLLVEINQPQDAFGTFDDQPSLVYSVEIDNRRPKSFQLLRIVGSPKLDERDGKEMWKVYYADEDFGSALDLINSALLTIERSAQD